jgi:hypothetical protein
MSVCEMTKAYYVVHSYVSAYSVGLKANLWYFWMERQAGLLEADLTPLPSYDTYRFAQKQLTNATYVTEVKDFLPAVRCYEFTRGEDHFWVTWSLDGEGHVIPLPATPSAIFDAFGNSFTPRDSIEVEVMPLYIEWMGE